MVKDAPGYPETMILITYFAISLIYLAGIYNKYPRSVLQHLLLKVDLDQLE